MPLNESTPPVIHNNMPFQPFTPVNYDSTPEPTTGVGKVISLIVFTWMATPMLCFVGSAIFWAIKMSILNHM